MVVDDRPHIAQHIQHGLQLWGFEVRSRLDWGEDVPALVERHKPSVAVLGIETTRVGDALALVPRLRAKHVPVVLAIPDGDAAALQPLVAARPDGVAFPPYTHPQFRAILHVALAVAAREHHLRRQLHRADRLQIAAAGRARVAERTLDEISTLLVGVIAPPSSDQRSAMPAAVRDGLSKRERDVLHAFDSTGRVDLTAQIVGVTVATLRNHLKSIYRKLGVHSQSDLIRALRLARRHSPVEPVAPDAQRAGEPNTST